jgi:glycine betaine/proline transport system substrate-binding protein
MKEKCPGLPNWEALKSCGEAFATPETAPKGRYLAGPVTWGGFDEERVEALGVPFEVVHAGTDAAMFAELESAYQRKAPIMLWIYTPHWAPIKYEGEWIQFPEYEDTCYNDPAWGVNPEKTHDCGKPHGWIKKVAWKGGEAKWPKAYAAIRKFQIDNKTMGELVAKVDLEGGKVEDVVAEWMKNNESAWKPWTE